MSPPLSPTSQTNKAKLAILSTTIGQQRSTESGAKKYPGHAVVSEEVIPKIKSVDIISSHSTTYKGLNANSPHELIASAQDGANASNMETERCPPEKSHMGESRTTTLNFKAFWSEVLACFENAMGEKIRRYDVVALKWKQSFRPKIAKFTAVYERVKQRDENWSSDLVVFQNTLAEYEAQYGQAFTLEPCWRILKNYPVWTELEMPSFNPGKAVDIGLDGRRDKSLHPADMLLYSWDGGLDVCGSDWIFTFDANRDG
ncbi:hypothetical protein Tco_0626236 [Tanacetum coccineum]|uniref:Uncharacterized protein n=1 Tax=Tanacetum coccineum TaxID=301880 RepID=A0ABQ4WJ58_9ASTR